MFGVMQLPRVIFQAIGRFLALFVLLSTGCGTSDAPIEPSGPVTFNGDIAPIVYKRCSGCHRPGQVGPFSLLTYDDAKSRAQQIEFVTQARIMPPWMPEPGKGQFKRNRRLTVRELGLIQRWISDGLLEGDPEDLSAPPQWTEGWQLGEPDLVVEMAESYTLSADGPDIVRNFVVPTTVSETHYVRGVEFRPGNAAIVHHVVILVDSTGTSVRLDAEDDEPGYDGMLYNEAHSPGGHFEGWTPGKSPFLRPADTAWPLEPGTDIVFQLHMLPTGKPEPIRSSLGLFFAERPPTRVPHMLRIGSKVIDIEAGDADYTIKDSYRLPIEVQLLSIYPHAHYLAKGMKGRALFPDGSREWLIHIQDWDFNWQDEYRYRNPISLPKGTLLEMEYTYDNSAENPRNPTLPPKRVVYGPQSSDEMGDLWFHVLPVKAEELQTLIRDHTRVELLADVAGYEKMVREKPKSAGFRDTLALRYTSLGRYEEAIEQWQEAIRLVPQSWGYYYNLGYALDGMKRTQDAVSYYRKAIVLKPDYGKAYNNLGVALQSLGRRQEAIRHLRKGLRFQPDSQQSHLTLASVLAEDGNPAEALVHFQQALKIGPPTVELHNETGRTLAALGKPTEATQHFQLVLEQDSGNFDAYNNLGNTLAAQGRVEEAIPHFRRALALRPDASETHGNLGLALTMADRSDEAVEHLQTAVRELPQWPAPFAALAWALATHPRSNRGALENAVQLGRRAVQLTRGQDARALDALAIAYASAGNFKEAVSAGQAALNLGARRPGDPWVGELRRRLEGYRNGQPFRRE